MMTTIMMEAQRGNWEESSVGVAQQRSCRHDPTQLEPNPSALPGEMELWEAAHCCPLERERMEARLILGSRVPVLIETRRRVATERTSDVA